MLAGLLAAYGIDPVRAQATLQAAHTGPISSYSGEVYQSGAEKPDPVGARIAPADADGRHLFFVRFHDQSLARYDGGIPGLPATSARVTGQRLDMTSPAAVAYTEYLRERQFRHLSSVSRYLKRDVRPAFEYLNVLNAVAVRMTPAEASLIEGLPFVAGVHADRLEQPETDTGPGLINAPAFWDGETTSGSANRGEGVVIGVIDTGFNHSHPAFAEVAPWDGYVHVNPLGAGNFLGVCAEGVDICNNKLIGSYNFHPDDAFGSEGTSSHGSHVASTAGGNPVAATMFGVEVVISGVAPRANLINYKVCQPTCPQTSTVAAVNQAIDDGVDVLNYSISGSDDPWNSMVDLAFLDAHAAGIFVAASAGNDGPEATTVAKTGPWNAAVAASTHARVFGHQLDVTGGPTGFAAVAGTGPALSTDFAGELRYAGDVDPNNIEGCDQFPADAFDNNAALISGGGCIFVTKINNAVDAGANFVVLFNHLGGPPVSATGLADSAVPTVMVSKPAGADLIAATAGDVAEITVSEAIDARQNAEIGDVMAGFSSRGPSQFNVLKPDFSAPGVSILAAATDAAGQYILSNGTSMSSPHVAGSAALIMAEHPDWTPAEVKSALALTATSALLNEDGETPVNPHAVGSGRTDLGRAATIGFVMDESVANYEAANPEAGGDPASLNQPSIQTWRCADNCSFERTIRSVVPDPITYELSVDSPAGMTVTVTPDTFALAAGGLQSVDISVDVSASPKGEWLFADVSISPMAADVSAAHMPLAIMAAEPSPIIEVAPGSLTATQQRDEVTSQAFGITNAGELPLEWSLDELGPQSSPNFVGPGVIWENPRSGNSGRINNFSIPDDTGVYQSDAFVLLVPSRIETIFSEGFTLGSPGVNELVWMVFANDSDVPAGHPETDPSSALWTFTAAVDDPGVSFTDANMALDLAAAGAPALELLAGTYWLTAFPTVALYSLGPNNLYAWRHGVNGTGRQVAPEGLSGIATDWTAVPEGRAFTLTGSVECTAEFNPWTNISPTSGMLDTGETDMVTVEFHSLGMLEGTYNTTLCISSNDPETGFTFFPVQMHVVNLPEASVSPGEVTLTAAFGGSDSAAVILRNDGLGELTFQTFSGDDPVCEAVDAIPWLSADPDSGAVAPEGGEQSVNLIADASNVLPGTHQATMCFETNDESNPLLPVDVTLEVTGQALDEIFTDRFE